MAFSFRRTKKRDEVIVDRVTGAFNRRQLDAVIAAGLDPSDQPTATLLVDIDHFENYNGKKGAASGDQVLERVSWVVMATVRTTDVVYRHGPSSFCALLPATTDDDAVAVADRIRANVEKMPLLAESRVTVSIGVATGSATDLAHTVELADEALAAREHAGINQVFAGGPALAGVPLPAPVMSQAVESELAEVFAAAEHVDPAVAQESDPTPVTSAATFDAPLPRDATPYGSPVPPAAASFAPPRAALGEMPLSPPASVPLTPPSL